MKKSKLDYDKEKENIIFCGPKIGKYGKPFPIVKADIMWVDGNGKKLKIHQN